jgi:hypothetical protein
MGLFEDFGSNYIVANQTVNAVSRVIQDAHQQQQDEERYRERMALHMKMQTQAQAEQDEAQANTYLTGESKAEEMMATVGRYTQGLEVPGVGSVGDMPTRPGEGVEANSILSNPAQYLMEGKGDMTMDARASSYKSFRNLQQRLMQGKMAQEDQAMQIGRNQILNRNSNIEAQKNVIGIENAKIEYMKNQIELQNLQEKGGGGGGTYQEALRKFSPLAGQYSAKEGGGNKIWEVERQIQEKTFNDYVSDPFAGKAIETAMKLVPGMEGAGVLANMQYKVKVKEIAKAQKDVVSQLDRQIASRFKDAPEFISKFNAQTETLPTERKISRLRLLLTKGTTDELEKQRKDTITSLGADPDDVDELTPAEAEKIFRPIEEKFNIYRMGVRNFYSNLPDTVKKGLLNDLGAEIAGKL